MNRTQWQSLVEQFHLSGMSISAFAKQHDLVYHQLLYRVQKSREQEPARDQSKPDLIPVILNSDKPLTETKPHILGIFQFPSGARLEIYDANLLGHLSLLLEA